MTDEKVTRLKRGYHRPPPSSVSRAWVHPLWLIWFWMCLLTCVLLMLASVAAFEIERLLHPGLVMFQDVTAPQPYGEEYPE